MSQYTENYHLEKPESNDDFENFLDNYGSNMDIIDEHLGHGGGGGSDVSWSQLQVTGDKIATIRISGIETDVYSPNSQTFSMAISRANIDSGEDYSTIFGKIKKYFADLKAVAFTANASDLTNDAGFITNTVNNLANYYLKSETYTQAEVNALIGAITTIHFEVVQTLPTSDIQTNVIYLVPKSTAGTNDVYDEYINTTGTSAGWELIGSTQVDLSNYYTKTQTDNLLAGKVSSVAVTQIQSTGTKIATISVDNTPTDLYAPNGGASALDDLTDVDITSPSNGQVLKYDASNNEWVNANEGAVEIIPNPVDTPTAQLNSLGFYGTNVVTVLDNGLVSTSSAYAWASYRTTLVTGVTYDLKLTDSFYPNNPIYSSFTWQGSTIVLTLGDRKQLTIEETRAGLTYFPGAWRQHYLDIKSQIQSTIYSVGNVSDNPTFTEASTRANIASGESFATILGKIKKWFSDLASMFVSKTGDTMTGELEIRRATGVDAQFRSTNTTNGYQISFGWGSGGTNRGIWDTQFAKWIFRSTGTDVTVNGSTVPANKTLASTDQIPTDFVSKTNGGVFTGTISVHTSSSTPLRNQTTAQDSNCYLEFSNGNGYLGWFAVSAGRKPCFQSASDYVLRELATTSDLNRLTNYYSSRPTSCDVQLGDGTVRYFVATSSMSTGKPTSGDAHILHLAWDNSGGWDGQLALPTTDSQHMQWRTQTNGVWGSWKTLIDSSNIGSQSVANSTKFNGLSMKSYATSSQTSIQIKISGAIRTGFLKIMGDGNGSGVDFIIPIHNSSVGTPVGHWVVAPSPVYIAGTGMFAISITVTAWNTLWVITNYDFY